jgi:hypothetical protein
VQHQNSLTHVTYRCVPDYVQEQPVFYFAQMTVRSLDMTARRFLGLKLLILRRIHASKGR